jgi:hypothetical protein
MVLGILRQPGFEIGEGFALVVLNPVLAVAINAKIERQTGEEMLDAGSMRIMAIQAFGGSIDSPMFDLGLSCQRFDVGMTINAQRFHVPGKQLGKLGVMWIMAIDTVGLGRAVAKFSRHDFFEFLMAAKALLVDSAGDGAWIFRIFVLVANTAIPSFKGTVRSHWLFFGPQGSKIELYLFWR